MTYICLLLGFILHAGILYFFGFWLFHLAHLFFGLAFPFKYRNFMNNYAKTAHIVEVTVIMVLGSVPGTVIIGTSKYQFDRFPPDLCVPSNPRVFFYTFSVAFAIGATVGLAMLFTSFTILRQVSINTCNISVCTL